MLTTKPKLKILRKRYLSVINILLHKILISQWQNSAKRLKQANLASKNNIADLVKKT